MCESVIKAVLEAKVIAIVRGVYGEDCLKLAQALQRGGIRMMEVTFDQSKPAELERTSDTVRMIGEHMGESMLLGAGTVTSVHMVELAKQAGAKFIVSPNTNEAVIRAAKAAGMVTMPGALTPTEVLEAHSYGADFVKLFPANSMGPGYLKAIRSPLNHVRLLAVGGVDEKNAAEYLKAGAVGVGVGGNLVNKQWIAAGEFDKITALAREYTRCCAE